MTFQVGDRVRVIKWAGWRQSGYPHLRKLEGVLCGTVTTVSDKAFNPHLGAKIKVDWDEGQYYTLNEDVHVNHKNWIVNKYEIEHDDNLFATP